MTWPLDPVCYPLRDPGHGEAVISALEEWAPVRVEPEAAGERTYYDTFDWRIYRAGGTIETSREPGGYVWVWRDRHGLMPFGRRPGRPPAFARDLPEGELREALEKVIAMRRLLPRVTVAKEGRVVRVLDDEEKTVVRVAFENGTVTLPDDEAGPLPGRIHVVPVRGYTGEFRSVISFLEGRFPLEPDDRSELVAALHAVGRKPADYSSKISIRLDPGLPAADAARKIHRRLLATMIRNQAGTRADTDSEFLHDFRVAIRRTRSALTQLKGAYPPADVERFREGFSWLGTATGPTRDLDVWLLKLPRYRESLPDGVRPHLDSLEAFLRAEQRKEQRRLVKVLDSGEYAKLIEDWRQFLSKATPPDDPPPNALRPVREVAAERIHRVFRRVLRKGKKIGPDSPARMLHRLRIEAKKLRYLLEFFRRLFDREDIERVVRALKQLQDNLGDHNDYEVQQAGLREFAARMAASGKAPTETLMAMGRLVERLEGGQAEERRRFQECFRRFRESADEAIVDRMFGGSPGGGATGSES